MGDLVDTTTFFELDCKCAEGNRKVYGRLLFKCRRRRCASECFEVKDENRRPVKDWFINDIRGTCFFCNSSTAGAFIRCRNCKTEYYGCGRIVSVKQGSICLICSEVKEVVELHGCGHALCVQCWRNLLEIFVPQASSPLFTGEEWAALLSCPVEHCGEHISLDVVRQVAPEMEEAVSKLHQRWSLQFNKTKRKGQSDRDTPEPDLRRTLELSGSISSPNLSTLEQSVIDSSEFSDGTSSHTSLSCGHEQCGDLFSMCSSRVVDESWMSTFELVVQEALARHDGETHGIRDRKGRTPLHVCASLGPLSRLLKCGFDGNARAVMSGESPLGSIIGNSLINVEVLIPMVDAMLLHCADVNAQDCENGDSPLHIAAARGIEEAVRVLIANGADGTIVNNDEKTPRDVAASNVSDEAFELPSMRDSSGGMRRHSFKVSALPRSPARPLDNSDDLPFMCSNSPTKMVTSMELRRTEMASSDAGRSFSSPQKNAYEAKIKSVFDDDDEDSLPMLSGASWRTKSYSVCMGNPSSSKSPVKQREGANGAATAGLGMSYATQRSEMQSANGFDAQGSAVAGSGRTLRSAWASGGGVGVGVSGGESDGASRTCSSGSSSGSSSRSSSIDSASGGEKPSTASVVCVNSVGTEAVALSQAAGTSAPTVAAVQSTVGYNAVVQANSSSAAGQTAAAQTAAAAAREQWQSTSDGSCSPLSAGSFTDEAESPVLRWLTGLCLEDLHDAFERNGITSLEQLAELTPTHLSEELKIAALGDRWELLQAINGLRNGDPATVRDGTCAEYRAKVARELSDTLSTLPEVVQQYSMRFHSNRIRVCQLFRLSDDQLHHDLRINVLGDRLSILSVLKLNKSTRGKRRRVAQSAVVPTKPSPVQCMSLDEDEQGAPLSSGSVSATLKRPPAPFTEADLGARSRNLRPRAAVVAARFEFPEELQMEDVSFSDFEPIGRGNFGAVYRANMTQRDGITLPVALKMLHDNNAREFTREALLMKQLMSLHHRNILKIYGCAVHRGTAYMVLEFAKLGNLYEYVKAHATTLSDIELLDIGIGIADAMRVLSGLRRPLIHRDLHLLNLLLDSREDGSLEVKVADFGLSRIANKGSAGYVSQNPEQFYAKAVAPEAFFREHPFSEKSDVWSFGVALWQLFSRGRTPYDEVADNQVLHRVCAGLRLDRPPQCPDEVWQVMLVCWLDEPEQRPSFEVIHEHLVHARQIVLDSYTAEVLGQQGGGGGS